ncbi:MAG: hypothetical protein M0Z87_01050 [Actinomycetota bacterium]|nr:hypothetical protein [Actinomycetota bacterium]
MNLTRRHIQISLGVLWLLDGALQLQPFMFTKGFAELVIRPAALGQPAFVADAVRWGSDLIAAHPVPAGTVFAAAQLSIGLGLLFPAFAKTALASSMVWTGGVWYFGEGPA